MMLKPRFVLKYKEREWSLPMGRPVRTIEDILREFCPITLFPSENIQVFVNGEKRSRERSIKEGDKIEIKDL